MTQSDMDKLNRGDIVRGADGYSYIVLQRRGKYVTAIREIEISNPSEWELFSANPRKRDVPDVD